MNRPVALKVNPDGIPDVLKVERRWTVWNYRFDGTRWTKRPLGKSNDPSTWLSFLEAFALYERGGYDGIEFALGDGWAGIDMDKCQEAGIPNRPCVSSFLNHFKGAYCERSPSDTGFKIFGRSDTRIGIEANFKEPVIAYTPWTSPRFFVVTGHGSGDPMVSLDAGIAVWLPPPPEPVYSSGPQEGYQQADELTDQELYFRMIDGDNGDAIFALCNGDTSAYGGDHSRADMAMLKHLAFWTNRDEARIDRMFQAMPLCRKDRWQKTYRTASLRKALQ